MESSVSRNCPRKIHRPSTPKKGSTGKKTPWERLPKGDKFVSLRMLRCRSWRSSIPLRNVLRQRKYGSFEEDLSHFLRWHFLRFAGPLNIFVPFLVLSDKKKDETKFEKHEENTKYRENCHGL